MVGTEGAHLSGDQKGLDGSSQPKFKPISWHRMVNHGDVFIQKLLQSAACRRFAGRRQRAGRARAQPNPLDPNTDLTCGQLWTFFSDFGLLVDAGHHPLKTAEACNTKKNFKIAGTDHSRIQHLCGQIGCRCPLMSS